MIKDKIFEHRPISELIAIVKSDFKAFDAEGLIDAGALVKTIMYCNDKLGLTIREVREAAIPVREFKAKLPLDFEKLYYTCGLQATNTMVSTMVNPFDNNVDQDIVYEARLDRESIGNVENYKVVVERMTNTTIHEHGTWVDLEVEGPDRLCHIDCPNRRRQGKYKVIIKDDELDCPFRAGMLYIMYIGAMKDEEGNLTFPFHPLITPYYEWTIKEKILSDAIFNSEGANLGELFKLAQIERSKAWLDAYNFTSERSFGEYLQERKKRELRWYNQYFKYFK